jgi:hypothetical protein
VHEHVSVESIVRAANIYAPASYQYLSRQSRSRAPRRLVVIASHVIARARRPALHLHTYHAVQPPSAKITCPVT